MVSDNSAGYPYGSKRKMQEAIRLIYQNNDIIFVSIHSLHKLSKYKGKDSGEPPNFEMSRNGQVFFINNRIQNIYEMEVLVKREVPDARIAVGHGQMEPEKLEKIILDFVNYEYDVLIATSIVESGIDVPNANMIIINNAQQFGLSDLHQLRGRVGRSNRKAFCYLLSPPLSSLTQEARRRLQAIENFSELGSGIHIATWATKRTRSAGLIALR